MRLFLFLVGTASLILTLAWGMSLFLFVFGDAQDPGAIARLPRWAFLPAVFVVFFYRSKPVERFFERLEKIL